MNLQRERERKSEKIQFKLIGKFIDSFRVCQSENQNQLKRLSRNVDSAPVVDCYLPPPPCYTPLFWCATGCHFWYVHLTMNRLEWNMNGRAIELSIRIECQRCQHVTHFRSTNNNNNNCYCNQRLLPPATPLPPPASPFKPSFPSTIHCISWHCCLALIVPRRR